MGNEGNCHGTVFLCDRAGSLLHVVHDDYQILTDRHLPATLIPIVRQLYANGSNQLNTPPAGAKIASWPAEFLVNGSSSLLYVAGAPLWNQLLVRIGPSPVDYYFSNFLRTECAPHSQSDGAPYTGEDTFRLMADAIHEVFSLYTADLQRALYVSPAYEKIWGRTCESLYQSPLSFLDSVYVDDVERVASALPKNKDGNSCLEYRIVRPDGLVRWIRCRVFSVAHAGSLTKYVAGVASDITELRIAEQSARESNQFAAIGKLTASIVHEMNNPLSAAWSAAETALMIQDDKCSLSSLDECLKIVVNSIRRCDQIVKNVMRVSSKPSEKSLLDVNEVVTRACDFAKPYSLENRVAFQIQLEDGLPKLVLSSIEIEQAIINIVNDAIDASTPGGAIAVRTCSLAEFVCIAVDVLGYKLFQEQPKRPMAPVSPDAFQQNGCGLGMNIVRDIIQEHGGTIRVVHEPGEGKTIEIHLPLPS